MNQRHADPRQIYGPVAELYDEVRPGYPEQLIADMIQMSGIGTEGRILEIGCGPGKATSLIARHGRQVLAVDPVPEMLAVARRRCAGFPNVDFVEGKFEDVEIAPGSFDVVVSAQAFHWIKPEVGYRKASAILKPGGSLALIWTDDLRADNALEADIRAAKQRIAPSRPVPTPGGGEWTSRVEQRIVGTGLFGTVETRRYPWSTRYDAAGWVKMLNTMSQYRALPEGIRHTLLEEIRRTIEAHGGVYARDVTSTLYFARKIGPAKSLRS